MFIDNPALARELLRVINISKLESAYRLRLDPKTSQLQWLTVEDDKETVLAVEPESTFWLRVHNMLLGWFVPEKLL
jgi:putative cardiolipin synthase